MQRSRLIELRKHLPEKYTISAYVINSNTGIPIGTPCLISLSSENITPMPKNIINSTYKMPKWRRGTENTITSAGSSLGSSLRLSSRMARERNDQNQDGIERNDQNQDNLTTRVSETRGVVIQQYQHNRPGDWYPLDRYIKERYIKPLYVDGFNKASKKATKKPVEKKKDQLGIIASKLYSMKSILEANKYLRDKIKTFGVYFPFGSVKFDVGINLVAQKLYPRDICYSRKVPIIYDNAKYFDHHEEFLSLCDTKSKQLMIEINSLLKSYRFINYTIPYLNTGNINSRIETVAALFKNINREYKHTIIAYETNRANLVTPFFDIMSISFYKIEDTIPIFDYKKLDGISVELTFLSSDPGYNSDAQMITARYLFSKYRENVLVIDGEEINSQLRSINITDTLYNIGKFLGNRVVAELAKAKHN